MSLSKNTLKKMKYKIISTFKVTNKLTTKRAIKSESDEHEEEYDSPEDRAGHSSDGLRVHDEH